ncbi:hypothetical protein JXA80_07985, partial [bacterium]|nr:hypothetical protein [candidate division CSSED10-310 bacterium]
VILDVFGQLFFAPSFSSFDQYTVDVTPGLHTIIVLPEFTWPAGVGSASNLWFYAGMTDPAVTGLLGNYDAVPFGWE